MALRLVDETPDGGVVTEGAVRRSVERGKASLEAAAKEVVWQIKHRAWEVLGYPDWDAMREAEYGGAAFMVPRHERPEIVAQLRAEGMTQQQIADTAGVTQRQVSSDLNRNTSNEGEPAAKVTNSRGQERPATYAPRSQSPRDPEQSAVEAAVAEFPDLAYYAGIGRARAVVDMASDLRLMRERGELDMRLGILRKSIALDKAKRDGTHVPPVMTPGPGMAGRSVAPSSPHCETCTCARGES